ncbi:hypothetical protein DK26_20330 [Bosea sp. WAO]|uniref:class I SAM-dependent methyltransferase n=1 Tax=Bosea sp. WAO TaxID=406341 RepID=UPI00074A0610|nr:class I SAM-dependent methyltransferase [Bosea sp. WAO]KUL94061.1 hypothetical protein DK26_20330 [Bosea sp. WAO]
MSELISQSERWDREWMHYFATEARSTYLVPHWKMRQTSDLRGLSAPEIFDAVAFEENGSPNGVPLRIWAAGDDLVGRSVLEIGCGCGWLGKRIGMMGGDYLGLDYSELALAIARGVSPASCSYAQIEDEEAIAAYSGSRDVMVGREFFIHQNFENATWVLQMGTRLLRPGGLISADFYRGDPAVEQGVIHPAKSPLDPVHASCAFEFSDDEVEELAQIVGLRVVSSDRHLAHQRQFVVFQKT